MSSLDMAIVGMPSSGWAYRQQEAPGNPWFSWSYLRDNAETVLAALQEHVLLTAASVAIAAVIAVPLGVLAHRIRPLTGPILALSGVLYTIPSLALFALLAPFFDISVTTVLIGLVCYALLIMVRNTLTGLEQVPADVTDAARGMGYGPAALLFRIELPLAVPSILTGLRIATVSTVAMVTIGFIVGHGGLGQLILGGFRNNFYKAEIFTGTVLCVALALVLDVALAGIGRLVTPWSRGRAQ